MNQELEDFLVEFRLRKQQMVSQLFILRPKTLLKKETLEQVFSRKFC